MNREWYDDFFDDQYLILSQRIKNSEVTENETIFLSSLIGFDSISVLDAPCGNGRISNILASKFPLSTFHGFDLNKNYVNSANIYAKEIGLINSFFWTDNMINFKTQFRYNIILSLYNSFGYFNEVNNHQVLNNFYNVLYNGGHLLLETHLMESVKHNLTREKVIIVDNFKIKLANSLNTSTKRYSSRWTVERDSQIFFDKTFNVRLYELHEITKLFESVGFICIDLFSGISPNKFIVNGKTCLFVLKKP